MELTEENILVYMEVVNSDPELAGAIWESLGMDPKDFFRFMEQVSGIRLTARNPDLIEELNEDDLNGAL